MQTGSVIWFEVMGENGDALREFYGELFGWTFDLSGDFPGYGMVKAGSDGIPGGVGQTPEGPGWLTFYVEVEDIDASIAQATARGGKVLMPPMELPDTWVAVVSDPEGRPLGLSSAKAA